MGLKTKTNKVRKSPTPSAVSLPTINQQAEPDGFNLPAFRHKPDPASLTYLQQTIGNKAVKRLLIQRQEPVTTEEAAIDIASLASKVSESLQTYLEGFQKKQKEELVKKSKKADNPAVLAALETKAWARAGVEFKKLAGQIPNFSKDTLKKFDPPLDEAVLQNLKTLGTKTKTGKKGKAVAHPQLEAFRNAVLPEVGAYVAGKVQAANNADGNSHYKESKVPTGESLKNEFAKLSDYVRKNIEGGFAGYVAVRYGLFNTFGVKGADDEIDVSKTIEKINNYYSSFVHVNFLGHSGPGHPKLAEKTAKAEALLKGKGADIKIKSFGTLSLRENRNAPSQLSEHSLGFAFDIDPEINPNAPAAVLSPQLVEAMTGMDAFNSDATKTFDKSGKDFETMKKAADQLQNISDEYKAAFKDEESLKQHLLAFMKRRGLKDPGDSFNWKLAEEGKKKELRAVIESLLPVEPEQLTQPASKKKKAKVDRAGPVVDILISAYKTFLQSRVKDTAGNITQVQSETIGTAGSVAAHGFINMNTAMIAALTAGEGGNLTWLGAAHSLKDTMHYELRRDEQPPLEVPPAPAEPHPLVKEK